MWEAELYEGKLGDKQNRSWSALEPSWRRPSRHGSVQDPFKSEQLILLSLSNEITILAKNGDFVRE